jgi:localization factor PodJL
MNSATAWNVRGVGRETRAFAEEAARRAGMSLGDWLDEVVADKAAEQGVEPANLERDDKLDAIGERIWRLSRRDDRAGEASRPPPRAESRRRQDDAEPGRDEARRADELLEAAIARLESRAERREARAARAFESVAQWIARRSRPSPKNSPRSTSGRPASNR